MGSSARHAVRLLVMAALLGVAGCVGGPGGTGQARSGIDETRAYPRAEQHLCRATAALGIDVRLVPELRNAVSVGIGAETGLVDVEVSYVAELPPAQGDVFERNRGVFRRLQNWWLDQGYRVVTDDPSEPFTVLRVVDPRDGFTVALRQGKIGNLWFTMNSGPVPATGVEPPAAGILDCHGDTRAPTVQP